MRYFISVDDANSNATRLGGTFDSIADAGECLQYILGQLKPTSIDQNSESTKDETFVIFVSCRNTEKDPK